MPFATYARHSYQPPCLLLDQNTQPACLLNHFSPSTPPLRLSRSLSFSLHLLQSFAKISKVSPHLLSYTQPLFTIRLARLPSLLPSLSPFLIINTQTLSSPSFSLDPPSPPPSLPPLYCAPRSFGGVFSWGCCSLGTAGCAACFGGVGTAAAAVAAGRRRPVAMKAFASTSTSSSSSKRPKPRLAASLSVGPPLVRSSALRGGRKGGREGGRECRLVKYRQEVINRLASPPFLSPFLHPHLLYQECQSPPAQAQEGTSLTGWCRGRDELSQPDR